MTNHAQAPNSAAGRQDAGESLSFDEVVRRYQAPVRGFLLRLARNYAVADDLAQEVFLTVHGKLDTFEGRGSFEGWLYRIAYNGFLQRQRADARRRQVTEELGQSFTVEPERYDEITADQIDLEQALARLSEPEAAAITLCHGHGFSHGESAAIMQLPLGTVKSHVQRGMAKLREMLTEDEQEL